MNARDFQGIRHVSWKFFISEFFENQFNISKIQNLQEKIKWDSMIHHPIIPML